MSNPNGRPKGSKTDPTKIARLPFKQSELMRGIRGVIGMGLQIERIEIQPRTGMITTVPVEKSVG